MNFFSMRTMKFLSLWLMLLLPVVVFAQQMGGGIGLDIAGSAAKSAGLPTDELPKILERIIQWSLGLVGILALTFFVYGGFLYITSAGDGPKIEKGKQVMTYAVLGIVFIGVAYSVIAFVIQAFQQGGSRGGS